MALSFRERLIEKYTGMAPRVSFVDTPPFLFKIQSSDPVDWTISIEEVTHEFNETASAAFLL
jgi:hypothetical protein